MMKFRNILTPCYCYNEKTTALADNPPKETGFDRVKRMYSTSEYGLMSPELFCVLQNASFTVIAASIIGAFVHTSKTKEDYVRKNVASTYESQYLAKRHLADNVALSAFRGGFKYAVKYGSFSSLYLISTMTVANYNNKITIWEHIGTGAVLGGILRLQFGPKGMAAAAGLGGFLGAFFGGVLILSMKFNNMTLQDLRDKQAESFYAMRRKACKPS